MQPYFLPYAGYFRLFAACDRFVIYDCVQFPRRGWVHRNQLLDREGKLQWLTLPLQHAPQSIRIADLQFAADCKARLAEAGRKFPAFEASTPLADAAKQPTGGVVDYLMRTLSVACVQLGIKFEVIRSSTLAIDPERRGQDRILGICKALGATRYVNSPGGRELYNGADFEKAGVELRFLAPYQGAMSSILQRLHDEPADKLSTEICSQLETAA
jgi:hypothetical protein